MKKIPILIVDDSEIDCYILERELELTKYEYHVEKKHNGEQALDIFINYDKSKKKFGEYFPPKIIFLDVNMPLMNGIEFLEKYRELIFSQKIEPSVVVMFTSSKNPRDLEIIKNYNFVNGYLVKGEYDKDKLESVIHRITA